MVLGVLGLVIVVAGAGIVVILSDGNPVRFVQTELIRLSLAGRQDELNRPVGADATPRRFTIESGDSPTMIGQRLFAQSLISDPQLFVDYVRVEGLDTQLEAGTYFLNQTQTISQIARLLIDSRSSSITFRIPEGSRLEEIAALIDSNPLFGFSGADFLQATADANQNAPAFATQMGIPPGRTLEGYMLPDTYVLPPDITATDLRNLLLNTFTEAVNGTLMTDAAAQGWTMHEVVTLASIIEREAVWADENPAIAGVYRNRLDISMRLEADPTVQYGLQGSRGSWWPQITQADYRAVQSEYNTYLVFGLPPGPIANPALSAVRAAIYPAESDYLYFRARCDGSHYHNFATTYEQHLANGCS